MTKAQERARKANFAIFRLKGMEEALRSLMHSEHSLYIHPTTKDLMGRAVEMVGDIVVRLKADYRRGVKRFGGGEECLM